MEKRLLLKNEEYEEREKDRRSKKRVKTRGGVDRPALRVSRTLIFIRPWQVYTDCIFHFEAIAEAQSRMRVKATELAPRYEVAVLHSPRPREPVHPRHCSIFLPPRRPPAGQRPPATTRYTTTL